MPGGGPWSEGVLATGRNLLASRTRHWSVPRRQIDGRRMVFVAKRVSHRYWADRRSSGQRKVAWRSWKPSSRQTRSFVARIGAVARLAFVLFRKSFVWGPNRRG